MPSREFAKKNGQMSDRLAIDATHFRSLVAGLRDPATPTLHHGRGPRPAQRPSAGLKIRSEIKREGIEKLEPRSGSMSRRVPFETRVGPSRSDLRRSAKKNARESRIHPTPHRASSELCRRARRGDLLLVPCSLEELALLVLSHLLAALLDHTTHWISPCSARFAPVREGNQRANARLVCLGRILPSLRAGRV